VAADDLSKLRIDRALAPTQSRRRRKRWWLLALVVLIIAAGAWYALVPRPASDAIGTSRPRAANRGINRQLTSKTLNL
jgi:4-amino-4-deoxy-L-arabinose transferase-like glycosyltransferase